MTIRVGAIKIRNTTSEIEFNFASVEVLNCLQNQQIDDLYNCVSVIREYYFIY